jgi:hypothetical protein
MFRSISSIKALHIFKILIAVIHKWEQTTFAKNGVTNLVMVMSEFLAYTYILEHFWKWIPRGFLLIKKYTHDTFESIDLKGSVTPVHKISK